MCRFFKRLQGKFLTKSLLIWSMKYIFKRQKRQIRGKLNIQHLQEVELLSHSKMSKSTLEKHSNSQNDWSVLKIQLWSYPKGLQLHSLTNITLNNTRFPTGDLENLLLVAGEQIQCIHACTSVCVCVCVCIKHLLACFWKQSIYIPIMHCLITFYDAFAWISFTCIRLHTFLNLENAYNNFPERWIRCTHLSLQKGMRKETWTRTPSIVRMVACSWFSFNLCSILNYLLPVQERFQGF